MFAHAPERGFLLQVHLPNQKPKQSPMKKSLLFAAALATTGASAQMTAGSICPDFTGTDLNGNVHNLYDYLDDGYTVVIDVSAAWCGPCWNYHESGALEGLHNQYGPGTAEDKVIVLYIEGEATNTLAQLQGTTTNQQVSGYSQGDWITGTPYPIIDDASIANLLDINYFPTIYTVCPNRRIAETSQVSTAQHWAYVQEPCNVQATNAAFLGYNGSVSTCGVEDITLNLFNWGLPALTSATVEVKQGGTVLASQNWTGNLNTWQNDEITFPNVTISDAQAVSFNIATPDAIAADNVLDPNMVDAAPVSWGITIEGKMDQYATEFSWRLLDPSGTEIAQGGNVNYVNENSFCNGTTPNAGAGAYANNATFAEEIELTQMGCYKVEAFDSYGDGLLGTGYFRVRNNSQWIVVDVDYGCSTSNAVVNDAVGVEERVGGNTIQFYPNPSNGSVNLVLGQAASKVNVEVYNLVGERVMSRNFNNSAIETFDMSALNNGMYYFTVNVDGKTTTQKVTLNR